MNSKEWKNKLLNQGSNGEDVWNIIKDFEKLERDMDDARATIITIRNGIVLNRNSDAKDIADIWLKEHPKEEK